MNIANRTPATGVYVPPAAAEEVRAPRLVVRLVGRTIRRAADLVGVDDLLPEIGGPAVLPAGEGHGAHGHLAGAGPHMLDDEPSGEGQGHGTARFDALGGDGRAIDVGIAGCAGRAATRAFHRLNTATRAFTLPPFSAM